MSEALLLDDPLVTVAEFDAFVERQRNPNLWELVAGRVFSMNNPTDFHEKIVGNVGAQLKVVTDQRQCHVFFGGLRVQRSDDARAGDKPRPDLLVRCGPLTGKTYATDPLVVVEVLSPSTFDLDRGDKLAFYKSLSTMRHIVFVYQDQMRVEHYRRNDAGWPIEVLMRPQDRLVLDAVTFETILDAVYDGVPVGF